MTMTPRPYLSYSQMVLVEKDPQKYIDKYIHNKKESINRNMAYGSMLAESLENDELTGDPALDAVINKMPKFEINDVAFEVDLKDGKKIIKILAKPDTMKKDMSAFKEDKTSVRLWTQRMADESAQITFYATAMWLKTGKIPQDIELVNAQVKYNPDGSLTPTGEIVRFRTVRTMTHIIRMITRMKRAHKLIGELCEKELL